MSRYAEGTSVPMERSRAEAEKTLIRYGATGFAYSWERRDEILHRWKEHQTWCPLRSTPEDPRPPRCTCGRDVKIERSTVLIGFKMKLDGRERAVRLEVPMPHELEAGSSPASSCRTG